ncbi:hypothetical protein B4U80_05609 [Leptotrombidium deliense]|uniref:Uncharacterized protein n=1 Tax=Leptotrombidium deliense TaxID=299467 RepID=A0A443SFA4_9ACAR|nr:hypothetical protein B4U80_05609 [Leptotrombidium deliense]
MLLTDRAKWRRQEKLENQNCSRNIGVSEYGTSMSSATSQTPHSPLQKLPSTTLASNTNLYHNSFGSELSPKTHSFALNPWLPNPRSSAIMKAVGLPGFMSQSSSVYPSYLLSPTSPGTGIAPLFPRHTLNTSDHLSVHEARTAVDSSPTGSPLNLSFGN